MVDHLAVAEAYQMQHLLIDRFGGRHGVRDKNAVEAAVFRPQIGYYNSLEEEAAALMESLGNNQGASSTARSGSPSLPPTSSCDATVSTSKSMREQGTSLSMARWFAANFDSPKILDWIRQQIKPLR
jgi:hypothetical protein